MLRQRLNEALKQAMKARDARSVSTLRLVLAALKERDIAARPRGVADGVDEAEIVEMLHKMVRQRRESIALYEQGNRPDLAKAEAEEIAIIEAWLPRQMDEAELAAAVDAVVAELGAASLKDMGRVMAALKERHAGQMDLAKAGARVKQKLG
ncbi:MAG: GatB/YqeY domain-containing protein [Dongiaceae bacterium]